MSSFAFLQDFWGDVVWCTTKRSSPTRGHILSRHKQSSETKISDFDIHILIKEYVAHLEIPMNNTFRVHIFDSASHLNRIVSCLGLGDVFPPFNHIHKRSIWAEFQDYIRALVE